MDGSKPLHLSLYLGRDVATLFLTLLIGFNLINDYSWHNYRIYAVNSWYDYLILISFVLFWCLISYWKKLYLIFSFKDINSKRLEFIKTYFLFFGLVIIFYSYVPYPQYFKRFAVSVILGLPPVSIFINFILLSLISVYNHNKINPKYTLIAGVGNLAKRVENNLSVHSNNKREIKGFIKCKNEECKVGQEKVIGDLNHIDQYLQENHVDEIVIALPFKKSKKIRNIINAADHHGIRVKYVPDYSSLFGNNFKTTKFGYIDAVNVRQLPLDETYAFLLKNTFDKVFSAIALLSLLPIFLLLVLLIKLDSAGPIFYCPLRIGKGGNAFKLYKFRSMHLNDATYGGVLSTQIDDPRVTRVGKILRKYSLDELPQFFNVLLGDMSVVGPRPHRSYLNHQLQESVDKYMIRHYFKPGITGWAQINGWRGPTDTFEQKLQRTNHDLWYMENWSFVLDLKIIYKTIFSVKVHKAAF